MSEQEQAYIKDNWSRRALMATPGHYCSLTSSDKVNEKGISGRMMGETKNGRATSFERWGFYSIFLIINFEVLSQCDSRIYVPQRLSTMMVNSEDTAQQPINLLRAMHLIASVFCACLLLLLHLINAYPIISPNGIPSDINGMKMNEWHLPWHPYGRRSFLAIYPSSTTWRWSCFHYAQDHKKGWGASESGRQCVKASLTRNVSVFLSCAVVGMLILRHSPFSSPQHHLQPESGRSHYLYSDGFFHQLAPILKTPIPESSCYHRADEFLAEFCLILENGEKAAFRTYNVLLHTPYVMTHSYCKFGKFDIPQLASIL